MNYWLDMDGVLAVYEPHAYKGEHPIYLEKGRHYFKGVIPDNRMIRAVKLLLEKKSPEDNVYIISSVSALGAAFTEQVKDKKEWLRLNIPELDVDTNFFPAVSDKRDVAAMLTDKNARTLTHEEVLIDDYKKNLNLWQENGGEAVKYLNGINSPDSCAGLCITETMASEEICEMLLAMKLPKF